MDTFGDAKKVLIPEAASLSDRSKTALNSLEKGSPIVINRGNLWQFYEAATRLSESRHGRYRDYDLMEDDALLASALELMTDDVCQFSPEKGATIWPGPGADAGFINQTFKEIDIENRLWGWTYNIAKYGDFFLKVHEKDGQFVGFDESIHPKNVKRIDIEGNLAAFASVTAEKFSIQEPWRYVHFINNYKPSFERAKIRQVDPKTSEESIVTITSRYGTSTLEAARKVYKILNLLEQAIALARLNRSPLIRVFYVNTEGMTPDERDDSLKRLEAHFKEQLSLDLTSGLYKADYKALSFNADIFIPYSGGKGDVRTETLGGETNVKDIADINYIKNKLFAALRIPQAFLGFEEAVPGGMGQMSLVRLDIRYARMVKKIQRAVIVGIRRMLAIRYALKTGKQPDRESLSVSMETISGVEEMDRMSGLERRMGVAQQLITMMRDMEGIAVDPTPVYEYVFSDILGLKGLGVKFKKKAPASEEGGRFDSDNSAGALQVLVEGMKSKELTFEQATPILLEMYKKGMSAPGESGVGDFEACLPLEGHEKLYASMEALCEEDESQEGESTKTDEESGDDK